MFSTADAPVQKKNVVVFLHAMSIKILRLRRIRQTLLLLRKRGIMTGQRETGKTRPRARGETRTRGLMHLMDGHEATGKKKGEK